MLSGQLRRFVARQMAVWPEARQHYRDLRQVAVRPLEVDSHTLMAQHNPARMVSTGARIDRRSLRERPCFLCTANRPSEQMRRPIAGDFDVLVNPFPILPTHLTIVSRRHTPQSVERAWPEIARVLDAYPSLMVFYNGPRCGASAPDHLHLQAGTRGIVPLEREWPRLSAEAAILISASEGEYLASLPTLWCPAFVIRSRSEVVATRLFRTLYRSLPIPQGESEPMMNIVAWRDGAETVSVVFPRSRHRPACYGTGEGQRMVSPGALDMAGLIITPRTDDYDTLTPAEAGALLREVSLDGVEVEPTVTVGIVSGREIRFSLHGTYAAKGQTVEGAQTVAMAEGGILWRGTLYRELSFEPRPSAAVPQPAFALEDVTIGVGFHWQRQETQVFSGTLLLVVEEDKVCAINRLPVERYLESVISSEMSATSSPQLLRAHAVISRSWLLAQIHKREEGRGKSGGFFSFVRRDDTLVRWYDREDHTIYDVCADDHCQRYQGITRAANPEVSRAVEATRGEVLMSGGEICDARFSKCCGGATEEFQYCWEDTPKSYLRSVSDGPAPLPDLTQEAEADRWIRSAPEAYCNTRDRRVLAQVLNDYDQETRDFYRWHVCYTQAELAALVRDHLHVDLGSILRLTPLERGRSGRISRLRIEGTRGAFTIGKELEIRRVLSDSHLYSSAFVVDTDGQEADGAPATFTLTGAGWGHGVGLCQIGAAVMGEQGYRYDQILLHYYHGAEIKKIY